MNADTREARGGRVAAWPMYAVDPSAVAAFWQVLRTELEKSGVAGVPAALAEPGELAAHWRDPTVLLSHTCGYPFAATLAGHVRYVATPRFRVAGCVGACYRSAVVVRDGDAARTIADLRGRRAAFNGRDSQSGYNGLRSLVAPHAKDGRFFASTIETGSHRGSMAALRSGTADVAAIDLVTLALVKAAHPHEAEGLHAIGHTELAPGLPVVTARDTSDADLDRLRGALARACDPGTPAARAFLLDGIEVLSPGAYDVILASEAAAVAQGYPALA